MTAGRRAPGALLAVALSLLLIQACGGTGEKRALSSEVLLNDVPSWVRRTPVDESDGYVYGVGYSPPAYFKKDTVENAKNAARVELAKTVRVVVKEELFDVMVGGRRSFGNRDEIVSISESVLDSAIEGSQILEVWHDSAGALGERGAAYALARAKRADLREKVKKKVAGDASSAAPGE